MFVRIGFFFSVWACAGTLFAAAQDVPVRALELPPKAGNARNSEGSFVTLKDGRILFVYTHFTGGGGDHDSAHLAGRYSADGGRTWTAQDRVIVPNEGRMNVMSVSLLRLRSGEIALFYLAKNSEKDCRPVMRLSRDEGDTWGEPVTCVTDEIGYYVMHNDRVIQLRSGRLVAPVSLHSVKGVQGLDEKGEVMCYLSDDRGRTWRRSRSTRKGYDGQGRRVSLQEPGVVELKDGRVMMFIRTERGCQYLSYSGDGGDTWAPPAASDIKSPLTAAAIKRLPATGDLLMVWDDHAKIPPGIGGRRVPMSTAISKDEGKTWGHTRVLEGNPFGWYCYFAVEPAGDAVLLGYCAMRQLGQSRITRVPLSWLYADVTPAVRPLSQADMFLPFSKGPFVELKTALGVWTAEKGEAEIHAGGTRGKGVWIMGGKERMVSFTASSPLTCEELTLFVERFTAAAPYRIVLEAKIGAAWQTLWAQDEAAQTVMVYPVTCAASPGVAARQFRFRCSSKQGAIIRHFPLRDLGGFFND
ncbi:MAG: sialidase family protein [Kiritimatiellia bacterium]|jgi:hypothetical protein|nr:sialidase family protein [Kiritimatiellia bacterium]